MDPLSQAVAGAIVPMSVTKRAKLRLAAFCGAVGGLFPDIDVVIKSDIDPLLSIEYHRQFTHALISIPFIGFIVAGLLWAVFSRNKTTFKDYYIFSTLGVATHGLLDTTTSYGTYIFWPFTYERFTTSNMSIIDPIFTLPLLLFIILAVIWKSKIFTRAGLLLASAYMAFTFVNHSMVKTYIEDVAIQRGHQPERISVSPSLGNNALWRTIYQHEDTYFVDAVHHLPFKDYHFFEGTSTPAIDANTYYSEIPQDSQMREDFKRFRDFTSDYIYEYKPYKIADLRYSAIPYALDPLWGIKLNPETPESHIEFLRFTSNRDRNFELLKAMVFNPSTALQEMQ